MFLVFWYEDLFQSEHSSQCEHTLVTGQTCSVDCPIASVNTEEPGKDGIQLLYYLLLKWAQSYLSVKAITHYMKIKFCWETGNFLLLIKTQLVCSGSQQVRKKKSFSGKLKDCLQLFYSILFVNNGQA